MIIQYTRRTCRLHKANQFIFNALTKKVITLSQGPFHVYFLLIISFEKIETVNKNGNYNIKKIIMHALNYLPSMCILEMLAMFRDNIH